MEGGKILVVDDDEAYCKVVRKILRGLGYDCVMCRSGEEALERYEAERLAGRCFCAVLLDIECGCGMNGLRAGSLLRSVYPSAKLILSSGHSDIVTEEDVRRCGFDANLPKPFRISKLSETLSRVLGR